MARRSDRRREYGLLVIVSVISSLPYVAAMVFRPLATTIVVLFMAYFQVMIAFATSTSTDTAHAVRFLLSGSNPIGMTGSSSLVLGAVDAIIDWTEDAAERRRRPWMTWALTVYKFAMTPIGYVLMIIEFSWGRTAFGSPKHHSRQVDRAIQPCLLPRSDLPRKVQRHLLRRPRLREIQGRCGDVPVESAAQHGL